MRRCIGVDPSARDYVCKEIDAGKGSGKTFSILEEGLEKLMKWIEEKPDTLIAIEGVNGMSKPLEDALRKRGIPFYGFKASEVEYYRRATLGMNKTNLIDAEAVGRLALAQEAQGRLERYRRIWFQDEGLVTLTREYGHVLKQKCQALNSLWKAVKRASGPLYLFLRGGDEGVRGNSLLKRQLTLELLKNLENTDLWANLSLEKVCEVTGARRTKGLEERLAEFAKIAPQVLSLASWQKTVIRTSAEELLRLMATLSVLTKEIERYAAGHPVVSALNSIKGVGIVYAAMVVAEVIDIRRFGNNHRLASYAGLAPHLFSTGDGKREYVSKTCNPRLKNAFMTMAKNIAFHDQFCGLARYYKSLVKKGMKPMEAKKRAARALLRRVYRLWMKVIKDSLDTAQKENTSAEENKKGDMAKVSKNPAVSGIQRVKSNIPPIKKLPRREKKVTRKKINKNSA